MVLRRHRVQKRIRLGQRVITALAALVIVVVGTHRDVVRGEIGQMALGEVQPGVGVRLAPLGQDARLGCRDRPEAPARPPGILELDGGHHAEVAQVVRRGQDVFGRLQTDGIGVRAEVIGIVRPRRKLAVHVEPQRGLGHHAECRRGDAQGTCAA